MNYIDRFYRGWFVTYYNNAPVTGRYVASRHGVKICANSQENLIKMLDLRSTKFEANQV